MQAIHARPLAVDRRDEALAYLSAHPRENLFLVDLTSRYGVPPPPGEPPTEIICAFQGERVVGVASLRPSLMVDWAATGEVVNAFAPWFERIGVGLVKSSQRVVDHLWDQLSRRRRRHAVVDRLESAYVCPNPATLASTVDWAPPPSGVCTPGATRRARPEDLDDLVVAARESLREEQRPDPYVSNAAGFRRWVAGRSGHARVVEAEGRVVFVGYADVQRPDGWLIQGVYTWPEARRRGYATQGVAALCREAFETGADHVQLAVVDGNEAATRLYERLGFKVFGRLRTILFT